MKRALRTLAAAASAAALMVVAAPAAQAGPEDLPDCTVTYVGLLTHLTMPNDLVTYTPPADVDVNGNAVVGAGFYVIDATVWYVDCVV